MKTEEIRFILNSKARDFTVFTLEDMEVICKNMEAMEKELAQKRSFPKGRVTPTHTALANAIDIWVGEDGVSPAFIANQLVELTDMATQENPIFVAYRKCLNRIEDYFEYRNESKKDREFVHAQMRQLVNDIKNAT